MTGGFTTMRAKIETWCKKHSHLLVFTGALIVFFTFVVKEGLREEWQNTAETIRTAEYFYATRTNTMAANSKLDDVLSTLNYEANKGSDHPLERRLFGLWRSVSGFDVEAAHLRDLTDSLPSNDDLRSKENAFENGIKDLREQLYIIQREGPKEPETSERESKASLLASSIDSQGMEVKRRILEHADNIRGKNELYSRYAWWISAFLFALGWGLGLVGKLYGVPEAAGGE